MELRIAAKRYYRESLEPLIDGGQIRLVGELDDEAKGELLRGASALLFPIEWPEPFGLVMIEAMACGTPVIAYRHGSAPEVIEEGVSGVTVSGEAEAARAVDRVQKLDRREVRRCFERRFSAEVMARAYL